MLPFLRDGPKVAEAQSDKLTLITVDDNGEAEQIVPMAEASPTM